MKSGLLSTTSALALLLFGGRGVAAPIVGVADGAPVGVAGQADVVRESLALASARPISAGGEMSGPSPDETALPAAAAFAQSPAATFTYQTAPGGTVPAIAIPNSRRNPGNVSNLQGTIGSAREGIFSVPAVLVRINEPPVRAYNYIFRPTLTVDDGLTQAESADVVEPVAARGAASDSVFIGVRPAVAEESGGTSRDISIFSATGSATPTVVLESAAARTARGPEATEDAAGYQLETPLATTIGFSTKDVRPTPLRVGAAATTTLGYTYVPSVLRTPADRESPVHAATLSMTITAPGGGLAPRDRWPTNPDDPRADQAVLSSTAAFAAPAVLVPGVSADTFLVAADPVPPAPLRTLSGQTRPPERIVLPVLVKGALADPGSGIGSVFENQTEDTGDDGVVLLYGLGGAAVVLPVGAAFLAFRLIRRAALRRLG